MSHFRSTSEGHPQATNSGFVGPSEYVLVHSDSQKSLDQLFDLNVPQGSVPLRNRNLPNSFFQHPANSAHLHSNGNSSAHQRSTSFNQPPAVSRSIRTHTRTQSTLAPVSASDRSNVNLNVNFNPNSNYSTLNQQNPASASMSSAPQNSASQNSPNTSGSHFRSASFNKPPVAMSRAIRAHLHSPPSNLPPVNSMEQLVPVSSSMEQLSPLNAMDELAPLPTIGDPTYSHPCIQTASMAQPSAVVGNRHYCDIVYGTSQPAAIQTHSNIPSMEHIESEMSNSCFIYDPQSVPPEEPFYMNPQENYGHHSY